MDPQDELRDFLMTRRARMTTERAGITSVGSRRVPGLRREEVAQLAGVSIDYYTRLEKGKLANPSDSVLDAVSRVLQLDEAEHTHLLDLVRAGGRRPGTTVRARPGGPAPRPNLQWMVDAMTDAVAFVAGPTLDVVAANHLARAMYAPMFEGADGRPNFARFCFLDAASRDLYPDWDGAARVAVGQLRLALGRNPRSRGLSALVGELATRSDEFRTLWAAHEVRLHFAGTKRFHHPAVGTLEVSYHSLELPSDPGHALTVYNAVPGSPSADALRLLASWAATRAETTASGRETSPRPTSS